MATSPETSQELTGLDQALQSMREDMNDAKRQSRFYDLFLNTIFHVPTLDPEELEDKSGVEDGQILPLVITSNGNDFLMIFDTEERLKNWAGAEVKSVGVPGHILAATTMPPLHIALNVGTEHSKQLVPDEITWLREIVERCNAEATAQEQPNP